MMNAVLKQQHNKMAHQQAIIQQALTQQSIRTAPWQQTTAAPVPTSVLQEQLEQQRALAVEQIQQSETNLAAQYQSIMQQQQACNLHFSHTSVSPASVGFSSLSVFLSVEL